MARLRKLLPVMPDIKRPPFVPNITAEWLNADQCAESVVNFTGDEGVRDSSWMMGLDLAQSGPTTGPGDQAASWHRQSRYQRGRCRCREDRGIIHDTNFGWSPDPRTSGIPAAAPGAP
jgi:hypothetical protein